MRAEDVVDLVRQMRAKQRKYFATKRGDVLSECRELERRVDKALADLQNKQPSLFPTDDPPWEQS